MKCITHNEIDAVATCARCSAGICPECTQGTFYQIDNKPLCKKCNYEVGLENDQIFKKVLRQKKIKMFIFLITFVIGLGVFFYNRANGAGMASAVFLMLLCWGIGFIGNFFDRNPDNRSIKAQVKDAYGEIKYPFSSFIGKILGFFVAALFSPFVILASLVGILRVNKQVVDNANVLNRFVAENTQQ